MRKRSTFASLLGGVLAAGAALLLAAPSRAALKPYPHICVMPPTVGGKLAPFMGLAWDRAQTNARALEFNRDAVKPLDATMGPQPFTPVGRLNALVLLVDFTDTPAIRPNTVMRNLFFGDGATAGNGSVHQLYYEASYGKLDLEGEVLGDPRASGQDDPDPNLQVKWLRMPHDYSWYANGQNGFGAPPQNSETLVNDALQAAKNLYTGLDWSQFDQNHDGFVDILYILHAGPGAEGTGSGDDIWSHQSEISDFTLGTGLNGQDIKVRHYAMGSEESESGTPAHEIGHIFGLPDLYIQPSSLGNGLGHWSLMASASWIPEEMDTPIEVVGSRPAHPDPWSKIQLGWLTPTLVTGSQTGLTLPPVETNPVVLKIPANFNQPQEYFLVENRARLQGTFDGPALLNYSDILGAAKTYLSPGLPGSGVLIYHVDERRGSNDDRGHLLVKLMEADQADLDPGTGRPLGDSLLLPFSSPNANRGDAGDAYGSGTHTAFTNLTRPNSYNYDSRDSGLRITNIVAPPEVPLDLDGDNKPDLPAVLRDNANATLDVLVAALIGSVRTTVLGNLPTYKVKVYNAVGEEVPIPSLKIQGGQFIVSDLPIGEYTVAVSAPGFVAERLNFRRGEGPSLVSFQLTPQPSEGTFVAGWNMVSLPYNFNQAKLSAIFAGADISSFAWNGAAYVTDPPSILGEGYWLYVRDPAKTSIAFAGEPSDITADISVSLRKGWNLIGNPYTRAITWDPSQIHVKSAGTRYTLDSAQARGISSNSGWLWNTTKKVYDRLNRGNIIDLTKGFWYYSAVEGNILIWPTPQPTNN